MYIADHDAGRESQNPESGQHHAHGDIAGFTGSGHALDEAGAGPGGGREQDCRSEHGTSLRGI